MCENSTVERSLLTKKNIHRELARKQFIHTIMMDYLETYVEIIWKSQTDTSISLTTMVPVTTNTKNKNILGLKTLNARTGKFQRFYVYLLKCNRQTLYFPQSMNCNCC